MVAKKAVRSARYLAVTTAGHLVGHLVELKVCWMGAMSVVLSVVTKAERLAAPTAALRAARRAANLVDTSVVHWAESLVEMTVLKTAAC